MSVADRSRSRVDEAVADLRERYGEFDVVEDRGTVSRARYSEAVSRFEGEGVVGGAGAWVTDPRDRVLLVRPMDADAWVDSGDAQRGGETLEETARRAVSEQAGIDADLTGVLRVEVYEYTVKDRDWPPIHALNVTFRGTGEGYPNTGEGIGAADWWRGSPNRVGYVAMNEFPFPATDGDA
jgi:ADP-ribose pyrophosphatase YjhB (NUDIX family)